MKRKNLIGNLLLLISAAVWGGGYLANAAAIKHIGVFTYETLRMAMGGLMLLPLALYSTSKEKKNPNIPKDKGRLILGGICCGVALVFASALQGFGLLYTTPGKGSFIASLYIVIVPLMTAFIKRKFPDLLVWAGVIVAVIGFGFLSLGSGFEKINPGDLIMLACAAVYSCQIYLLGVLSPKVNTVALACIEFFAASGTALVLALIFDKITLVTIGQALLPLLYTGIISGGIGFTLQAVALKMTDPSIGSLIMSLESVFALLFAWIITNETLLAREYIGCMLVFMAVILSQIPTEKLRLKKK